MALGEFRIIIDETELKQLTALRHDLHAHPELGFEENRTSGIVASRLEEAGVTVHRGLGRTGVVGTLTAGTSNRAIALRTDMDALAMPELADRPYPVDGCERHACLRP